MSKLLRHVTNQIREIRRVKGVYQREIGEVLGVTQARVSQLENGTNEMTLVQLEKIADLLGYAVQLTLVPREDQRS